MSFEALIEMFTDLSLRRRNGVLQLRDGSRLCELGFADGKIVGVEQSSPQSTSGLARRLRAAGVISQQVFDLLSRANISLRDCGELLITKKILTAQQYQRFKKAEDLDLLYSLRHSASSELRFDSKHVSPKESAYLPESSYDLAPGQILLDMAELLSEDEKFKQLFPSDSTLLSQANMPRSVTSALELELWQSLAQPRALAGLLGGALNEHELKQGLLSLLESGSIRISSEKSSSAAEPKTMASLSAELAALDLELDSASPAEQVEAMSEIQLQSELAGASSEARGKAFQQAAQQTLPVLPLVNIGAREEVRPLVLAKFRAEFNASERTAHKLLMSLLCLAFVLAWVLPVGAFSALFAAVNEITISAETSMVK